MDIKEIFEKIGSAISNGLKFTGWLLWSFIRAVATVITFLIIFVLLSAIIPLHWIGVLSLILLLWFMYTNRHKVTTIIAILIAIALAIVLFNTIKYTVLPNWIVQKYTSYYSFFKDQKITSSGRNIGLTDIENETIDELTCAGSTNLDNVIIKGPLTVNGQLGADTLRVDDDVIIHGQATLSDIIFKKNLNVHGQVTLDTGTITGKTNIQGQADIKKCHLQDLVIEAKEITLAYSTIKNIYLQTNGSKTTITLIDSKITGDIVFDGGNGKVILKRESSIGGKIIGGEIAQ